MKHTKEFVRQQIGGQVPSWERDQCGYCGDFYTVTIEGDYGVCPADSGRVFNGLVSEGDYFEDGEF